MDEAAGRLKPLTAADPAAATSMLRHAAAVAFLLVVGDRRTDDPASRR